MKRGTRKWLEVSAGCDHVRYSCKEANCAGTLASDALASDARQRAEIRGLKKRLKLVRDNYGLIGFPGGGGASSLICTVTNLSKPLKEKR